MRQKKPISLNQKELSSLALSDIAAILSDEKTTVILKAICSLNVAGERSNMNNDDILRLKTNLTPRQYYSSIHKLIVSGLIRPRMYHVRGDECRSDKSRSLTLTSIGQQICSFLKKLETGLNLKPKLRALDSLEMSGRFTKEEREKIIDTLIDDAHTKNALKQEPRRTRDDSVA